MEGFINPEFPLAQVGKNRRGTPGIQTALGLFPSLSYELWTLCDLSMD